MFKASLHLDYRSPEEFEIWIKKQKVDPNRPVEQISWKDIQEQVVKKLNKLPL